MSASHARVALGGHGDPVFARHYAHAGMVRLGGEKMSKSLGNLVFVSGLLAAGTDPMAIRLAILAHHYRADWDWTDAGLAAADARLARAGGRRGSAPPAAGATTRCRLGARTVLAGIRERLADDLDAPGALPSSMPGPTPCSAPSRAPPPGGGRPAWSATPSTPCSASPSKLAPANPAPANTSARQHQARPGGTVISESDIAQARSRP